MQFAKKAVAVAALGLTPLLLAHAETAQGTNPNSPSGLSDTQRRDTLKTTTTPQPSLGTTAGANLAGSTDAEILSYIHEVNLLEVEAGKLAKSTGQSRQVKDYGERLQKEHAQADKQVMETSKKEQLTLLETTRLPAQLQAELQENKAEAERLKSLKGAEFDKAFLTSIAASHDKVIQNLTSIHETRKDTAVGKLIGKLLPSLKKHGEAAHKLRGQLPAT